MEDSLKVIFNIIDYKEKNRYCSIKFENLSKELYKIDSNKITMDLYPNKEDARVGKIDEVVYIIPEEKNFEEKKFNITLFLDIVNIFNLEVNDDGNCAVEITKMWDVDYSVDPAIKERGIPDIIYNGKESKNYEKLYERKRWNFLNAKVENFGGDLFSQKTIDYIKGNIIKSFKYDILIRDEQTDNRFLTEKIFNKTDKLLDDNEKEKLKDSMKKLISQIVKNYEEYEIKIKYPERKKDAKNNLSKFQESISNIYENFEKTFDLYNKRWNLDNFLMSDLELFSLFSELQINYNTIIKDKRMNLLSKYKEFKKKIMSEETLNFFEKIRIICGFAKFSVYQLKENDYPELIIVKELKDDDKFNMAIESFKKVIAGLEEYSGYFKKLLMFETGSSEILNEWDVEEIKIENMYKICKNFSTSEYGFKDFKMELESRNSLKKIQKEKIGKLTFPMLSMLTLKQIKEHCMNLIPTFFFKVSSIYSFNAVSDVVNRVTFYNEVKILEDDYSDFQKLNPKECVLPLMIEISHETYSHIIIRYSNSWNNSPLLNPIKDKNKFLCSNDFSTESGFAIEYFFIDDYKELNNLKTPGIDLFELTNPKYWTGKNFNAMKEFNRVYMQSVYHYSSHFASHFDKRKGSGNQNFNCVF
jgi:hypothetical protein